MGSRREFLAGTAAAGLGLGLGALSVSGCEGQGSGSSPAAEADGARTIPKAEKPLKILVLGGTAFLGPAQVEYALARGHPVTLFNRGRTNPELFPNVEKLVGDRDAPD